MYFVHSYAPTPDDPDAVVATCDYGGDGRRRGRDRATCWRPSSTRRSRAPPACGSSRTSSSRHAGRRRDGPLPGHRPAGGRCVRLYQGDYDRETVYGDDPVAAATAFADAGAPLDPRRRPRRGPDRRAVNRAVIAAIAEAVSTSPVQAGGGVRTDGGSGRAGRRGRRAGRDRHRGARGPGARRASSPARQPVAVGLDATARRGRGAGLDRGLGRGAPRRRSPRFADAGVDAVVVTDIARDGTLAGPDLDGLAAVLDARPRSPSSRPAGSATLADLAALAAPRGRRATPRGSDRRPRALRGPVRPG